MISENFKNAIRIIQSRLDANNLRWAVVGSTNAQLQGMDVQPRDLDIVMQYKDLEGVSNLFSDYSATPVNEYTTKIGKICDVKAKINGVEIQFFGGDDADIYTSKLLMNQTVRIELGGMTIPCFTLEADAQAYTETKRGEKARLIKEFLGRA